MIRGKRSAVVSVIAGAALAVPVALVGASPAAAQSTTSATAPANFHITDLGSNHVAVAWDPVPDDVLRYSVELQRANGQAWRFGATEDTTAGIFLDEKTTAKVRVRAHLSDFSRSEWTDPLEFTTPPAGGAPPSSVPTDLQVIEQDPVGVTLGWQSPIEPLEALEYHRIQVWRKGETCCLEFTTSDEASHTFHLERDTTYLARVSALDTVHRYSDHSEEFEFTTVDEAPLPAPEDVQLHTPPGEVEVSWQPSSSPIGVDLYRVALERAGTTETTVTRQTETDFLVPEGGDVTVTVQARDTAERWSDPSTPAEVTVPPHDDWEGDLTAPRNLQLNFDDNGVVQDLQWDPPQGGDGSFVYDIHYRFGNQDKDDTSIFRRVEDESFDVRNRFAPFVECEEHHRLGDQVLLSVVAHSQDRESPRSEESIPMCM